ncbi:hypothetical protein [Streptomyces sp. NEAU-174]|uniref:hypothetical protein n=1 Tax=Streptomyces sp. NEAU-174 TaxID=3458254 RepID=UPI004044F515
MKWSIILLDLLTPYFGGWSKELTRTWHYDVSDIRSAMIEGALAAGFSLPSGIPSKKLLDTMMTRAFAGARGLVEAGSPETCAVSAEYVIADATHEEDSTLRASSIIDASTVRDPDANERIRGERTGSLLQRMGAMGHAKILHDKIRSGCRNEAGWTGRISTIESLISCHNILALARRPVLLAFQGRRHQRTPRRSGFGPRSRDATPWPTGCSRPPSAPEPDPQP